MPFTAILLVALAVTGGRFDATGAPRVAAAPEPVPATSHAVGAVEACSLLTKEIATEALGEPVRGPKQLSMAEKSSCEYTGSGIHTVHLILMRLPADQAQVYAGLCAQKNRDGLSGLGNVACWYDEKHGELQVLKGKQFFSIEMQRGGDPTEAIKHVARQVFDKLP